uniref:Pseudo-response regulator 5 n=1 Tax=Solanum tuberosum TaxID=4113 RepID=M0ZIQ3_SOLTU
MFLVSLRQVTHRQIRNIGSQIHPTKGGSRKNISGVKRLVILSFQRSRNEQEDDQVFMMLRSLTYNLVRNSLHFCEGGQPCLLFAMSNTYGTSLS